MSAFSVYMVPRSWDGLFRSRKTTLVNPPGLFYVVASVLPSTLGANAGLLGPPVTQSYG
jgi:hypothetical protein